MNRLLIIIGMIVVILLFSTGNNQMLYSSKPAIIDTMPQEQAALLIVGLVGLMIYFCIRYSRSTWYEIHIKQESREEFETRYIYDNADRDYERSYTHKGKKPEGNRPTKRTRSVE